MIVCLVVVFRLVRLFQIFEAVVVSYRKHNEMCYSGDGKHNTFLMFDRSSDRVRNFTKGEREKQRGVKGRKVAFIWLLKELRNAIELSDG